MLCHKAVSDRQRFLVTAHDLGLHARQLKVPLDKSNECPQMGFRNATVGHLQLGQIDVRALGFGLRLRASLRVLGLGFGA